MSLSFEDFKQFAVAAARLSADKHGTDILVLDLSKTQIGLCEFVVVVTANSDTHLRTLAEAVKDELKKQSLFPLHREGLKDARWSVLDYGGFMVHVMHQDLRALYAIERLWPDAKKVNWSVKVKSQKTVAPKRVVKTKKSKTSSK